MSKGIDELAREHAPRAIELLADTMESAMEDRDRIRAAEALLDRGYGKPAQAIIQVPANRRLAAVLAAMSEGPSSVNWLRWGEQGFDPQLPDGHDVRDWLSGRTS